jgi:lipid II:glycine glycyltransferase (peptidoglycan interpeptide bridge formation enzyme)
MPFRPAEADDGRAWQDLLERCPAGDFLHDWAWAEVARFDGQPQRRFVLEEDGRLTAIVAAQERRLPLGRTFWYVPHGPVLDHADGRAAGRLAALLGGLREAARRVRAVAVRLEPRLEAGSAATSLYEAAGLRRVEGFLQVGHTRIVALADDETLLASFDKDTRYSIRRAEREGVEVTSSSDSDDTAALDALYQMTVVTQRRAHFPQRPRERYALAWRSLAGAGRATIFEARDGGRLLAAAMLVLEGERSFYYLAGSRREEPGETKLFPTYALQWALMRHARDRGAREHDLWGVAPPGAGSAHPWFGVGLFKRGFDGRMIEWAGMWDLVVDPMAYRLREVTHPLLELARGIRRR